MDSFEVHAEFPFDSDRKRMSLVISNRGKHYLMTKGADSIMLPRINFETKEERLIYKNL